MFKALESDPSLISMTTQSSRPSRNIREQVLGTNVVTVDIDDSSMKTSRKITLVALLQSLSHKHRYIGWLIRAWRRFDRRLLFDPRQRIRTRLGKYCRLWGRIWKAVLAPTRSLSSSLPIFWSMRTFQLVPYPYGKWNPVWVLWCLRINLPLSYFVSFASFSVYNARIDSESYPIVRPRDNQNACLTQSWVSSLHHASIQHIW